MAAIVLATLGACLQPAELQLRRDWRAAFRTQPREFSRVDVPVVAGRLPEGLRGTLYKNGPARFERGGIEYAFMSTTMNREVALSYADDQSTGTVLEIRMGMVDRGADVSWLSQFPGEQEILFAPLTGLEVVGKRVVPLLALDQLR